jgi:hypothetical protein
MNRRWVWLKWLIIPAIWLSAFERPDVSQEFNEYDLVLLDLGAMALLVIVALSVDRRKFLDWFSSLFLANSRKSSRMLLIGCVFVLCIASVLYISFDISRLLDLLNQEANIEFGFGASWALALVLAFFLTAFGVMNWKLVVPLVLVFYASDFMTYWFSDMLSPGPDMPLFPDDSAHDAEPDAYQATFKDAFLVRNGPGMVLGTCAALLGHALRPFWLYRESSSLRTARTTLTLLWVLIIYFVGFRFFEMNVSAPDLMVLGGLGYAMGLIWRIRGIVAAPAIMQLCLLLALTVIPSSDYHTSAVAFEAINVGLVVFPFAFVGFLSNRLESLPERPGALTPRAQGIK